MSYGYSDGDQFSQQMKSGGQNVLCMEQTFGIAGCPDCAQAKRLYDEGDAAGETFEKPGVKRKAAKLLYHSKIYQCFAIVRMADKPQNEKLCIVNIPKQQVEEILKNVMHKNPDVRWPDPADIAHGRALVIDKTNKSDGSDYAQYSTKLSSTEWPIEPTWWAATAPTLPSLDDPIAMQKAIDSWPAENKFSPYSDMKKGEFVSLRLLPHNVRSGATPFITMKVHFKAALGPWENAWRAVGYDPAKQAAVQSDPAVIAQMQALGLAVAASASAIGVGYAGTPVSGVTVPGSGVTLPSVPNAGMDSLPPGY